MKVKEFFKDVLKGAGIGVAAIIPGVSGGSIAVILKIYGKLVGAVHNLFKSFVKSFLILLPIALGILIGFGAAIIPIQLALQYCMLAIVSLFAGLLAGSIPDMTKYVRKEKPKWFHIVICVVAGLIAAGIGVLSATLKTGDAINNLFINKPWYLYILLIFVGLLAACGFVVPGISGSMLMMITGFYRHVVDLFSNVLHGVDVGSSILMIACVAIGIIAGFFAISIAMDILLTKHETATYWAIIGFVAGSIISLFLSSDLISYVTATKVITENGIEKTVNVINNWEIAISPFVAGLGFVLSFVLIKYANKRTKTDTIEEAKEEQNA